MATISTDTGERVFTLKQWMGLHESPDGDTKLKIGEANKMVNWRVTRDGNLAKRGGTKTLRECGPVMGIWAGSVNGTYIGVYAADNTLYKFYEEGEFVNEEIGSLCTERRIGFVPYQGNLYILNGEEFLCYDGMLLDRVEGYVPVVVINLFPNGTQVEATAIEYEQINKLSKWRKIWLTGDGTNTTWTIPETVNEVLYVKDRTDDSELTYTLSGNDITIPDATGTTIDLYEVCYSSPNCYREEVDAMRFGELYTGIGDVRILLYGDGSNKILYSEVDYNGNARADYFPDLNVANIGISNSPVNGIVRHGNEVVVYKSDSTYTIQDTTQELTSGLESLGFVVKNVNRQLGCDYLGEVILRENNPITLFNHEIYEWQSNSYYTSNLSYDERQSKRISDNVYKSCREMDFKNAYVFDDNAESEVWITDGSNILVNNYAVNSWYRYDGIRINCMARIGNYLFIGSDVGVLSYSDSYYSDDGRAIEAYWESGYMPFDTTYKRKFSAMTWVAAKQLTNGYLHVRVDTDRTTVEAKKDITSKRSSFLNWNFSDFSFKTGANAKTTKLKLKAKKFVYYKLVLISDTVNTSCLVTDFDILVRETGNAK